jgi:hypothetical protein
MGGHSEQVYAEYFPSQSHFYAGKLLRSAPLRAISGSSGHPISVLFLLLGSRDLVEQDQISFVTFWHCCDVHFKALNINKKASPTETKARRRRRDCRTSLSLWCSMVCCSSCFISDLYMCIWL